MRNEMLDPNQLALWLRKCPASVVSGPCWAGGAPAAEVVCCGVINPFQLAKGPRTAGTVCTSGLCCAGVALPATPGSTSTSLWKKTSGNYVKATIFRTSNHYLCSHIPTENAMNQ